jgi:DNA replication protein DnaC
MQSFSGLQIKGIFCIGWPKRLGIAFLHSIDPYLRYAKLKGNACVEDIDYGAWRGLDRTLMRSLANDSGWVGRHENIFLVGPTSVGKSWLACALAQKACRDGYLVLYTRAAALIRDLAMARADGSLRNVLGRLACIDVLVIDDWAMAHAGSRAPRLLGYLRRALSIPLDHPHIAGSCSQVA